MVRTKTQSANNSEVNTTQSKSRSVESDSTRAKTRSVESDSTRTKTRSAQSDSTRAKTRSVKSNSPENENQDFEVDPELLDPKYNQLRRPSLPYGIIINDEPAGILIPVEQLTKAGWRNTPNDDELTTIDLTEEVTGLLLTKCRLLVLASVPEYVRWKDIEDNGEQAGTFIASYDEYRSKMNKKTQEVCSEHALMFLDSNNKPLHKLPIVVRFKNVALWSFKAAKEKYYQTLEKVFAEYHNIEYSGKSDKWRSLGILQIQFKAIKEGKGKNKSPCCKTYRITQATLDNFPKLFLGTTKHKQLVWKQHNEIAGFTEINGQLPAIAASVDSAIDSTDSTVEVLPPEHNSNGQKIRQVQLVDDDLDELDELDEFDESDELEELDELDEFDKL